MLTARHRRVCAVRIKHLAAQLVLPSPVKEEAPVISIAVKIWNRRPQTKSGRGRPAESKIDRSGLDLRRATANDIRRRTPSDAIKDAQPAVCGQ